MLRKIEQIYAALKAALHELGLPARLVIFGLLALCIAMALPSAKHSAFGWSLLLSGGVAGMAGFVVAILTYVSEYRNNPNAKFHEAGSPFLWGVDIGLTIGLCVYMALAALSGYVFLGYLLYTAIV